MPLIGWLRGVLWPALDCLTAGFLLALSVLGALGRVPAFGAPAWLTVTAAVLVAAPLAVRRIWPAGVFAVAAAANAVLAVAAVGGNPAIAVALALYIVAVRQPPRRSLAA